MKKELLQKMDRRWVQILPSFSDDQIDDTWKEYEKLIEEGEIVTEPEKFGMPGRYLNLICILK